MLKYTFAILGGIVIFVISLVVAGRHTVNSMFERKVIGLYSLAEDVSAEKFSPDRLEGLPEPVRRYFRLALPEGQPDLNSARLRHGGVFRTGPDKPWAPMTGEEYLTAAPPGFVWRGYLGSSIGHDSFVSGRGRFSVALFGAIKLFDLKGEEINRGEFLRWLVEGVFLPTALLPRENLKWTPVDAGASDLSYYSDGVTFSVRFFFNPAGEITGFETMRQVRDDLVKWTGTYSDYREFSGIRVPTRAETVYHLRSGEFSYARVLYTEIEFNRPERYPEESRPAPAARPR